MEIDSAVFYTSKLDQSIKFYRDVLKLEVDYIEQTSFASFYFSNGVRLGIKIATRDREVPGRQTIFIKSENIVDQYNYFKKIGIEFYKELVEEKWGSDFAILDPDGNKLEFLERK